MTTEARILGTDRRKMSKSYGNAINLGDPEDTTKKKVLSMLTDPARIKMADPGHPEECNVYSYYKIFADESLVPKVYDWCSGAKKGCVECKMLMADVLLEKLRPIREQRKKLEKDLGYVNKVLKNGYDRASEVAKKTMIEVKDLLCLVR